MLITMTLAHVILRSLLALEVLLLTITIITKSTDIYANALPITSKPIENTAENLAWQTWLGLSPEQKSQQKSRKVTPKSIFTLPNRKCPDGQVASGDKCISKLDVDQDKVAVDAVFDFLNRNPGDTVLDYDYVTNIDDVTSTTFGGGTGGEDFIEYANVQYDVPEKISDNDFLNFSNNEPAYELPTHDEPLKFNLFQGFPTDVSEEPVLDDSVEPLILGANMSEPSQQQPQQNLSALHINGLLFFDAIAKNLSKSSVNQTVSSNSSSSQSVATTSADMQAASSNESVTLTLQTPASPDAITVDSSDGTKSFPFGNIDAIILPALPTQNSVADNGDSNSDSDNHEHVNGKVNLESFQVPEKKLHKISLFKDDSALQLVTVAATATATSTKTTSETTTAQTATPTTAVNSAKQTQPTLTQDKQNKQTEHFKNNNDTKKIDLTGEQADLATATTKTTTAKLLIPKLNPAAITTTTTQEPQTIQADLSELLKADSLLPLLTTNFTQTTTAGVGEVLDKTKMQATRTTTAVEKETTAERKTSTESESTAIETSTTLTPSSMSQSDVNDETLAAASIPQGFSTILKDDFDVPDGNGDIDGGGDDDTTDDTMMQADSDIVETATLLPPLLIDGDVGPVSAKLVAHAVEGQSEWSLESSKDERTRSIATTPVSVEAMQAQEIDFTTTTEPLTTTNIQLDETTIIETAPNDIAKLELQELQQQQQQTKQSLEESIIYPPEQQSSSETAKIVKKSKVEPVELPADDVIVIDQAEMPASPLTADSVTLTATPSPIFKVDTMTTKSEPAQQQPSSSSTTPTTAADAEAEATTIQSDRFSESVDKLGVVAVNEENKSEDKIIDGNNESHDNDMIVNSDNKPDSQRERNTVAAEILSEDDMALKVKVTQAEATTIVGITDHAADENDSKQFSHVIDAEVKGKQQQQQQSPQQQEEKLQELKASQVETAEALTTTDNKSESSTATSVSEKTEALTRSALAEIEVNAGSDVKAETEESKMSLTATTTPKTTAKTKTTQQVTSVKATHTATSPTATTKTSKTPTTKTTTASWSKIMPTFETSTKESIQSTEASTMKNKLEIRNPTTMRTTSKTSSKSFKGKNSSEEEKSGIRSNSSSNKNSINDNSHSKILNVNSVSSLKEDIPPESSEIIEHEKLSKALIAQLSESELTTASDAVSPITGSTTSQEPTPLFPSSTTSLPEEVEVTSTRVRDSHSIDSIEPFWWLPIGWHLDSDPEVDSHDDDTAKFTSDFNYESPHRARNSFVGSSTSNSRDYDRDADNSILRRFLNALNRH